MLPSVMMVQICWVTQGMPDYLTTWNISGGWNMHNSDFLHNHKWVNLLKLKLTYGLTGGPWTFN